MTKIFTENDLLRYLYDEVNEDERLAFRKWLNSTKTDLHQRFSELVEAKSKMDAFEIKAPDDVISRILYTSQNLQSA
ncbi:MAG: hypothetical protein AAF616_03965 [Bacteroidota bacterium]